MKILYLECNAGISGDMVLGALSDLLDDPEEFTRRMKTAGIPEVKATLENADVFGIAGIRAHITVDGVEEGHDAHHHEHHTLANVIGVIQNLNVSDKVKEDAIAIYRTIAEAEAEAHGQPVDLIHFHEVGALDAVADIVGACILFEIVAPEKVISSPVRTGFGQVHCAHGLLPVPAPATASILKGIPAYAGDEEGEFCTPTGAAILKHFADEFSNMPTLAFDRIGIGLGSKQFKTANMLRAFLGDVDSKLPVIDEITCNIDDMTPEDIGGIIELLLSNGALDAFIRPCTMKKGRPGFELTCLSKKADTEDLSMTILAHTSTIGLRIHEAKRYAMSSRFENYRTDFGDVRIKISEGFGLRKWKPEYNDLVKVADGNGVTLKEIRDNIRYDPDEEED